MIERSLELFNIFGSVILEIDSIGELTRENQGRKSLNYHLIKFELLTLTVKLYRVVELLFELSNQDEVDRKVDGHSQQ